MTTINNSALDAQFKTQCKVISLKNEYGVDATSPQWAIASALSKEDIEQTFPEQVANYLPFIALTSEMGEVIQTYNRNENKHFMRRIRSEQLFDFIDGETEAHHTELQVPDFVDYLCDEEINREAMQRINEAFSVLTEIQRERIYLYFYEKKRIRKIASDEGVDHKTVVESIQSSLKKMKKFLKTPPQMASLSGNK